MVLSGHRCVARHVPSGSPGWIAVLARPARPDRRVPRWWSDVHVTRATSGARQAVLVGNGLRHGHTFPDPDGSEEGRTALAVRAEGREWHKCRSSFRTDATAGSGGSLDQDHSWQGMVLVLPHLWPRRPGVRRQLEAGRLRESEIAHSV